ncbi:MAG TPA: hypothetical protein VGV89_06235 [Thermoplasmata archaeon]|nr:hypothetical protein [Thermoplasmata archaeon]
MWPWQLPTYVGNVAAAGGVTEPDWYFLWVFKLVDFAGVTPVIAVAATNVILLFVLFLPFLDRSKRTHPRDRPLFLIIGNFLLGFFIMMTVWGGLTPGLQIPVQDVALRLAPIFLVNLVVVWLFYWRYQKSYRARLEARERSLRLPGIYGAGSAGGGPAGPVPAGVTATPGPGR